jgi:hypothetical protein
MCDECEVMCKSRIVLWAELPGAEIRHLPGRTAFASSAELGRTAGASGTSSIM